MIPKEIKIRIIFALDSYFYGSLRIKINFKTVIRLRKVPYFYFQMEQKLI